MWTSRGPPAPSRKRPPWVGAAAFAAVFLTESVAVAVRHGRFVACHALLDPDADQRPLFEGAWSRSRPTDPDSCIPPIAESPFARAIAWPEDFGFSPRRQPTGCPRHSQSATPSVATPTAGRAPDADRATTSGSDRRRGGRLIRIGIATGNPEHPLRDEIAERMRHTIGVAGVGQTATQARRQLQTLIGRAQQDRAAVRTGVRLVERSDQRLGDEVRKENSLRYRGVVQQRRLRVYQSVFSKPFVSLGGVSVSTESRSLVINPG